MSGRTLGSAIGLGVGFMFGQPQLGMSIGGMVGGVLMPDEIGLQDQQGPKLSNLKITSSTYGKPIAKVYGSYRIGGNVIWSKDIKETKHVEEVEVGKGGSETYEVITYTYSIDMAVAFCEGPVGAVRRIWFDSVLIFDGRYFASWIPPSAITIYKGNDTDDVNWLMQADNPDTPAYRNVCYIVLHDVPLDKFGNRIPNITAEIVEGESDSVV